MYKYKSGKILDFSVINKPAELFEEIKNGRLAIIDMKSQQRLFEITLGNIRKTGNKSDKQKETIANLNKYYNTWEDIIQLLDYFSTIASEAKHRAMKGERV